MRVGILGGAFNPPHIGHLVCAQEALVQLELERVLFVPVGVAPHRELEYDPGAFRDCRRLSLHGVPGVGVDRHSVMDGTAQQLPRRDAQRLPLVR